jgi:glycerol-3-phosphate acyltransferase PlsY
MFPAWIGFRGGKGVATAAGVFSLLAPLALAVSAGAFLLTVVLTRYISLGSLAGSVALAGMTLATPTPLPIQIGAIAAALLVGVRHRANVARVIAGRERRIGVRV